MGRKQRGARDPDSTVPFIVSGVVILAAGIGGSYLLFENSLPEETNNDAALVLGLSIIISGILFITAWAKRK